MKKFVFLILTVLLPLAADAQTPMKFGYFSYDSIFKAMPDYAMAQKNIDDLRNKYDAEMKRSEDEFNAKYEEFLDGQRDFVPSIMHKRQNELQDLMEKNVAFKKEALKLLDKASADFYAPARQKIAEVLAKIGKEGGYAFILNTDNNSCPFIDPTAGDNVAPLIRAALKIQ